MRFAMLRIGFVVLVVLAGLAGAVPGRAAQTMTAGSIPDEASSLQFEANVGQSDPQPGSLRDLTDSPCF